VLPDPATAVAVDIVANALGAIVEADPARVYEPGADLSTAPAVGIAAGFPWAQWRTIGVALEVRWIVRVMVGRWETGPALDAALATYRTASRPLRAAGYNVDPLEPPTVVTIGGVPMLAATFPITYSTKE
jgi:hypothetical protein